MSSSTLALPPRGRPHRFPHKKIVRKVLRASRVYSCQIQGAPCPDHRPSIDAGELYVRVSLPSERPGGPRFSRSVRLCGPCAVHLGLAIDE